MEDFHTSRRRAPVPTPEQAFAILEERKAQSRAYSKLRYQLIKAQAALYQAPQEATTEPATAS